MNHSIHLEVNLAFTKRTSDPAVAVKKILSRIKRRQEAIRHSLWSWLYVASKKYTHGHRFLLINYAMAAYSYLGERLHRSRQISDSDLPCKHVHFNAIQLDDGSHGSSPTHAYSYTAGSQGEYSQGQKSFRHGLLVNGGDSIIHEGQFLCGRWRERSAGHTIKSTEIDYHHEARDRRDSLRRPVIISGRSLCLTGPWSDNYFHWLIQYLPILRIATECSNINAIDNFLVKGPVRRFQIESLEMLGIPEDKIIGINRNQDYIAEELIVTTIPCDNRTYAQWVLDYLRTLRSTTKSQSSSVFFDRLFPATRRIVNSEEVYALLKSYDVDRLDCSKISFRDQISYALSANLVVGVHGASLVNCVFSLPGSTLIELTPRNYSPSYFKTLAHACSLRYERIMGKEPGYLSSMAPIKHADIIVPMQALRSTLDSLCSKRTH